MTLYRIQYLSKVDGNWHDSANEGANLPFTDWKKASVVAAQQMIGTNYTYRVVDVGLNTPIKYKVQYFNTHLRDWLDSHNPGVESTYENYQKALNTAAAQERISAMGLVYRVVPMLPGEPVTPVQKVSSGREIPELYKLQYLSITGQWTDSATYPGLASEKLADVILSIASRPTPIALEYRKVKVNA